MFPDGFRLVFIYLTASDENRVMNRLRHVLTLQEMCKKYFNLLMSSLISAKSHENRKIKLLHSTSSCQTKTMKKFDTRSSETMSLLV